jgi:hypothetical protein
MPPRRAVRVPVCLHCNVIKSVFDLHIYFRTMMPDSAGTLVIVVNRAPCFSSLLTPEVSPPSVSVTSSSRPVGPCCATHDNKPLRAFCLTCDKSICDECAANTSLCQSHDTRLLSAVIRSAYDERDAWRQVRNERPFELQKQMDKIRAAAEESIASHTAWIRQEESRLMQVNAPPSRRRRNCTFTVAIGTAALFNRRSRYRHSAARQFFG